MNRVQFLPPHAVTADGRLIGGGQTHVSGELAAGNPSERGGTHPAGARVGTPRQQAPVFRLPAFVVTRCEDGPARWICGRPGGVRDAGMNVAPTSVARGMAITVPMTLVRTARRRRG